MPNSQVNSFFQYKKIIRDKIDNLSMDDDHDCNHHHHDYNGPKQLQLQRLQQRGKKSHYNVYGIILTELIGPIKCLRGKSFLCRSPRMEKQKKTKNKLSKWKMIFLSNSLLLIIVVQYTQWK